jgi:hypothetical protein
MTLPQEEDGEEPIGFLVEHDEQLREFCCGFTMTSGP